MEEMKVVVTGATGHVGRYAVAALASAGHEVIALSRSGALPEEPFGQAERRGQVRGVALDLTEESSVEALTPLLTSKSVLVHLAAWHPERTAATGARERRALLEANVHGTLRVLEAARRGRVAVVVYASTFEVYGDVVGAPITEESRVHPITDYGATKLSGEDHLLAFAYEEKARVVALRMPAIYGPGEKTPRALPNFLKAVARGELPTIHGDGADLRDQLYVADAARAICLAVEGEAAGIFNIADGRPHSIQELAALAIEIAGLGGKPLELPRSQPRRDYHMSIDKARRELGFQPQVPLRAGMTEQLRWLRSLD
jgi:nucleoside-diphosphate-sugar epimerase